MSSILIDNGNLSAYQLAPGAKLQYLQDGTLSGSATYNSSLSAAGSGIAIGATHPYNSLAKCSESEVTYLESNAECFSRYIGVWSSAVQKVTTIASLSAAPITQCPNWIAALGGDAPDGYLNNFAYFDGNGNFVGFPGDASYTGGGKTGPNGGGSSYSGTDPYRLGGVQSFFQGSATIRINYSSTSSSTVTDALSNLGSILQNLVAGQISYSFDYYAFICTSVTYEETPLGSSGDAVWNISEEYLLLPAPGLDPAIYK